MYFICSLDTKLHQVKASVKSQGGEGEDPDSRMDSERADRRDKKGGKGKVGIRKLKDFVSNLAYSSK